MCKSFLALSAVRASTRLFKSFAISKKFANSIKLNEVTFSLTKDLVTL